MVTTLRLVHSVGSDTHSTEDADADVPELDVETHLRTTRVRELLDDRGSLAMRDLVAALAPGDADDLAVAVVVDDVRRLVACGLVAARDATERYRSRSGLYGFRPASSLSLTDAGVASLTWAAPPTRSPADAKWCGDLVRALAAHYGVEAGALLRSATPGPTTVARARLCYALYGRGWSPERIEEHLGLPGGWAGRGIERWRRLRARVEMRTGEDLLRWRARWALTQAAAAATLGVSERTLRTAEAEPDAALTRKIRRGLQRVL